MSKKVLLVVLTIFILLESLLVSFGLSGQYVMKPSEYFLRIKYVFDNIPTFEKVNYNDAWVRSRPEYETIVFSYPSWQKIEVDSAWDVVEAVTLFMNNCITYIRSFFVQTAGIFPKLWNNIEMTFVHWFTPVTVTFENIAQCIDTVFFSSDWVKTAVLAFVPLDWQQIKEDGVEIKLPFSYLRDAFKNMDDVFGDPDAVDGWRGGR